MDTQADERVAAAQVVVEEGEGRADGEAVQPERDLGQFDGQRVLVDAVDAAFEDHAADDGLVGELGLVDHPIGGVCPRQNVLTDSGDAFNQGRCVGAFQPGRDGRRVFDQFENGVGEVVDSGDEEVAAAHGRVEHFEVERGFGGVETAELGDAVGFGAFVALQSSGFGLEGSLAFLQQRREGALDDEIDERLGRVEAAAVLACVAVGADDDLAVRCAGGFALEQALVDRAKLLHGHITVVDKAAAGLAFSAAKVVDDRGQHGVGEAYLFEHGRGLLREKAAIVGRQADGGVALVDLAAKRGNVVVIVAGDGGKGVAGGDAFVDVVANGFAQAVVVVAAVVDGQQIAVLGVEKEEQTVEEDQGGLADMLQFGAALVCEGADQGGIDFCEDDTGKIVCDLFFVAAAFGDGVFKEAGLGAMLGAEGGATEEEAEGAQSMGAVVGMESGFQVDFVVTAGARKGAAVVETPDAAVGEDAPADAPVRVDVGGGKIAEDLAVR